MDGRWTRTHSKDSDLTDTATTLLRARTQSVRAEASSRPTLTRGRSLQSSATLTLPSAMAT